MMSRNVRNLIHKTVVLVMLVLVMGSNSIANAGTGALSDTNSRSVVYKRGGVEGSPSTKSPSLILYA
jgi:hypothetical protein